MSDRLNQTRMLLGRFVKDEAEIPARGLGFLLLYALAWGGGVVAYVPLLTLLLPAKIEAITPQDKVALLSAITFFGAVVAGTVNIAIGIVSDRTAARSRGRRPWVAAGLVLTLISYGVVRGADGPIELVCAVLLFQAALNLMLAPLAAVMADEIPDRQKGLAGGLMGAVYTLGALAGIAVTASSSFTEGAQLAIIGVLVLGLVLPFLVFSRERGPIVPVPARMTEWGRGRRQNLVRVWIARLLIQISGSIFFAYLLFYFETVDRSGLAFGPDDLIGQIAWLSGSVTLVLAPLAIATGRLSDAMRSRKPFLVATAAMTTAGLLLMALLPQWAPAAAGYVLFASGVGLFLALQNAYAVQLLIAPQHRGRDMGLLNLTNTIPAIIAPVLVQAMASTGQFRLLLMVLACLTAAAFVLTVRIDDRA